MRPHQFTCLLAILVFAALFTTVASAAGINLGWIECGGLPTSMDRTLICNNNTFNGGQLVGSYVAPANLDSVDGNEIVVDVQTEGVLLPDWWKMGPGGCRPSALQGSFDFSGGPSTCFDYWAGQALGSFNYSPGYGAGNRARITLVCAIDGQLASPIAANTEVYAFKIHISGVKSSGFGSCTGCSVGACIVLNSIKITQDPGAEGGTMLLANPAARNFVTWQGGISGASCPAATVTRRRSWGAIKALYR